MKKRIKKKKRKAKKIKLEQWHKLAIAGTVALILSLIATQLCEEPLLCVALLLVGSFLIIKALMSAVIQSQ